jgi:hypothetical protein
VRVVDDSGADVVPGSGVAGEVVVRGPTVFGGYIGSVAAATAGPGAASGAAAPPGGAAGDGWLQPGGWFRTGDVALDHGNGYMTVVDRKKDMVGGFKEGAWKGGGGAGARASEGERSPIAAACRCRMRLDVPGQEGRRAAETR